MGLRESVKVFFTSFDVENSNGCNNDYLEYDGKKYCGYYIDPIFKNSNQENTLTKTYYTKYYTHDHTFQVKSSFLLI